MWGVLHFAGACAVAVSIGAGPLHAQTTLPSQEPQLRIDPGMQTAEIWRIGVDASCTLLATGSDDKTVRLWGLPEGRLINTLRPPIGPGDSGKIFAVAVAPDGSWVAAGGWTVSKAHFVFIFHSATGRVMTRLGPLANVVHHLAVSPDGQYLAATLGSGLGVRVWRRTGAGLADWRLVAEDKDYGGKNSNGAAFDAAGALFTVAYDGKVRRYAPDYTSKPASVATRGGGQAYSVAVHPSDDRIAVSFSDTTAVEVYDAASLEWRFAADTTGVKNGNLGRVAWSADGMRLYAGGQYGTGQTRHIRVWDRAGEGPAREIEAPASSIMHLLPCGDGLAVGAADPAFGLLAPDGGRRLWREAVQADLRGKRFEDFTVSDDGL